MFKLTLYFYVYKQGMCVLWLPLCTCCTDLSTQWEEIQMPQADLLQSFSWCKTFRWVNKNCDNLLFHTTNAQEDNQAGI